MTEKFNGFYIVRFEYYQKEITKFVPIYVIYNKPVKNEKININCYFSTQKHLAYRSTYKDAGEIKHSSAWHCDYCSKHYSRKDKYERHLEHCRGMPGIVYNFDTHNLVTFDNNLKYKGDLP